jgi:hypothetical protein
MIYFSQIQGLQLLRDEIEQIDVYQVRTHSTSYSKEFGLIFVFIKLFFRKLNLILLLVENMQKYTTDLGSENRLARDRRQYTLRHYFDEESTASVCYLSL